MKAGIILLGLILVILNTVIGGMFDGYATHSLILTDVSLILSTLIIFFMVSSSAADGFKIGLSLFFCITGLIRFICAFIAADSFKNNFPIIIFLVVLSVEIFSIFISNALKNK